MNAKTTAFLDACRKAGYRRVAVGVHDRRIKCCCDWPFSPHDSVFASPNILDDGYPVLWQICDAMLGGMLGGNGQQAQPRDMSELEPGSYDLKSEGCADA